jgi:hypothetical protein
VRGAVAGVVLAIAACGGSNPAQTQVRIVIRSDLPGPLRELRAIPVRSRPSVGQLTENPTLPYVLAVTGDEPLWPFSFSVLLSGAQPPPDDLLLVRNARDVPFVKGAARMFELPMYEKCACRGSSCPPAGDPDCADLVAPPVTAVDDVTAAAVPDGYLLFDGAR